MKIHLAEVYDNTDLEALGTFYVTNKENDTPFKVWYTTPYLAGKNGGFIAIPEIGSRVLICQPDNDDFWYYIGTTLNFGLAPSLSDPGSTTKEKGVFPDKKIHKARGVPQRLILKSPKGNALILSDEYNPDYFNVKAELKSGAGKGLKLIDSPFIDCIIIENEHGDRIKISTNTNGATPARSIELECKGNIDIISRESSINMKVVDGRQINIINSSTGSKRSGPQDPTCGKIKIESENNDIEITTKGDAGSVFIEAEGSSGHVQIKSKGKVSIEGDQGVDIISSGGNIKQSAVRIDLN